MPTHRPPPTVTPADVESDIKARIDALSQPGGALVAEA
jgi:hypothetical protein